MLTWEDFILHYCAANYLSDFYYITDISKAAMTVKCAKSHRDYCRWGGLLKKEIEIVGQPDCRLIPVGKIAEEFLHKMLPVPKDRICERIIHYSPLAGRSRGTIPATDVSKDDIRDHAVHFLTDNKIPESIRKKVMDKLKEPELTLSRKRLIFAYREAFKRLS